MSKKFKNLNTGLIEEVSNPILLEQYEKYDEVYQAASGNGEPTIAELKAKATELGLDFAKNIKKDELIELINSVE